MSSTSSRESEAKYKAFLSWAQARKAERIAEENRQQLLRIEFENLFGEEIFEYLGTLKYIKDNPTIPAAQREIDRIEYERLREALYEFLRESGYRPVAPYRPPVEPQPGLQPEIPYDALTASAWLGTALSDIPAGLFTPSTSAAPRSEDDAGTQGNRGAASESTVYPELDSFLLGIGQLGNSALGSLASGAFVAYSDAIDEAIDTGHFAVDDFGAALRSVAASTIRSVGQQAAVKGGFEVGEGIVALATGDEGATGHFVAAGKFFAVAAVSGAAAGALSTGPGGGKKDKSRDEHVEPDNHEDRGRSRAGSGNVTQRIVIIGNPSDEQVADLQRRLAPRR